jgi:hypothetical protein
MVFSLSLETRISSLAYLSLPRLLSLAIAAAATQHRSPPPPIGASTMLLDYSYSHVSFLAIVASLFRS